MTLTPTVLREYDRNAPDRSETDIAVFGLGCFWGPDATFGALDGVVRTAAGYAGGTKPDPTYHALGDHTEVVRIEYDPSTIGYDDLLETVFEEHHPEVQAGKRQYHNLVLLASDEQAAALDAVLADRGLNREGIETRIERLSAFTPAEPYHQKFNLSDKRWITEPFEGAGYDDAGIRDSPAAAKLNAHVAGHDGSLPFLDARSRDPV